MLAGIGCVLLGVFPLVAWWFAMFSGSDWGDLAREGLSGVFSLGRNTIAVIEPAVGSFLVFGGMLLLAQAAGFESDDPVALFFGVPALVSLVVGVLGLVPVRLPGWMYPEWHEERRWRRAQQAEWEARYGSKDEGDGRTD
ncbi:hypothetical protein BKH13_05040 [Actinomyces naeslundii]|uniref:Integral membrane protein n=1 Tax=Actinomyces naeslundii TaxID=1655 RepID=A0ABX3EZH6_ACTNA|nr:hypothetical protein [Actinomyces naeslundii]OLO83786.1 hypothetical protein BKH13_05040 [Actinomyces naeslundii]OLO84165.1 hypothetical protein BKH12_07390 [Actinomyces naeslundii]OLO91407.1 hypothetical protein BKH10_03765 [Actinomyces naeslundii]